MKLQPALTRIHKALGWAMLFLLPVQLLTGLWAVGKMGGQSGSLATALHVGPWAALALGAMIISHGLLGIRFAVTRKLGVRTGAVLLVLVWLSFIVLLSIITLR